MLKIDGKTFMNLQEAVQWLLDNNALPFQSTANYASNTEIGIGTIVNPTPAKVRIGSLIFFADSKVSTVTGLTENGFICSDKYNNLVDDVAYVTNVAISASGHLITTMSDGQTIDAGLIKQVSNFSINGSQHLVVNYNDGTSTDLGAIFSGNITIDGTLSIKSATLSYNGVEGQLESDKIIVQKLPDSIIFTKNDTTNLTNALAFAGVSQNGEKITFALYGDITKTATIGDSVRTIGGFDIPKSIGNKLVANGNTLAYLKIAFAVYEGGTIQTVDLPIYVSKWNYGSYDKINFGIYNPDGLVANLTYSYRIEITFLTGNNLAS